MIFLLMPSFKNWVALDAGTIDYDQNAEDTIAELPDRLKDTARDFFRKLVPVCRSAS